MLGVVPRARTNNGKCREQLEVLIVSAASSLPRSCALAGPKWEQMRDPSLNY